MVRAGILLVDKPGGITSHDVVSRARRALGTRKIGHAGTLDPLATGLLVLGVEGATRLLTYIVGADKTYEATILLGVATESDDADGVETTRTDATALGDEAIAAGIADLTGEIDQVPSTVSAIKVAGRRAYDLARAGEEVVLKARRVTVSRFDVLAVRRGDGVIELDVVVDCTSGTYIRALARDLGRALGVGGHLTMLRRTRIGEDPVKGVFTAAFPPEVRALDRKPLVLTGFMLPLDAEARSKHFLLSRYTPVCFFCPPGEPNEVVEVTTHAGVPVTDRMLTVSGRLSLTRASDKGLFFRLDDAVAR